MLALTALTATFTATFTATAVAQIQLDWYAYSG